MLESKPPPHDADMLKGANDAGAKIEASFWVKSSDQAMFFPFHITLFATRFQARVRRACPFICSCEPCGLRTYLYTPKELCSPGGPNSFVLHRAATLRLE
jgi:hypothetical protein